MTAQITNPLGAFGQAAAPYMNDVPFKLSGTVSLYDVVEITYTESTAAFACRRAGTGVSATPGKVGVAQEAGISGETIMVRVEGPTPVNIGVGGVVAIGESLILTATAGTADGVVADATTVAGTTYGRFMSDEIGTSDTAMVWVR